MGSRSEWRAGIATTMAAMLLCGCTAAGQQSGGDHTHSTAAFDIALDPETQVLVSLAPKDAGGFDFAPVDRQEKRSGPGYYHLGDIDLRYRQAGAAEWQDYSSALRDVPVRTLDLGPGVIAAADLVPSLPDGSPLGLERRWLEQDGDLVLSFRLSNSGDTPIEIGALGIPMVFNNILTDRSLEEAHAKASFADPYIGRDAGYVQVTRLSGEGPALLVLPEEGTPFEAYKPILDETAEDGTPLIFNDPTPRGQTFEGFYDWMVASQAFAEQEWRGAEQWNPATTLILKPGETREVGVRFVLSPSIRAIEDTLVGNNRPLAIGIPGYVLPMDLPADLFLKAPQAVAQIDVHPAGALSVSEAPRKGEWTRYRVAGKSWGRARLDISYADGSVQSVHYFVMKPSTEALADMGRFLTTEQWYDDPADPFGRAPSIMSYDNDEGEIVLQDRRAWIAGLSDEGGAGAWLAAIMKQLGAPNPTEIAKFERFVTETLDGGLQVNEGPEKYGVRKSLFFYDPEEKPGFSYDEDIDWTTWASWDVEQAHSVVRSFNYVHVAAAYWTLYRLARYQQDLVKAHDWRWYLEHAHQTALAMPRLAPHYAKFGQMEGDVFVDILDDLKREGLTEDARTLEAAMKARADVWAAEAYPFGSEMPWDSTGQPEVYAWMRYFGEDAKADLTREVILGYDPTLPHWGYNGNARRYWDFLYAGKTDRLERQIHHYGSSNNAIPLFDSYRRNPDDMHLLRVAYGGLMGSITNIDEEGFASAAFHANPDMLRFDGYSGDYGTSFFGHAYTAASYLTNHDAFGWIGFGGPVEEADGIISITPKDSFRRRVFIAPAGLWLTLAAGHFERVDYDPSSGAVTVRLAPADRFTPAAYLEVETTVEGRPAYAPVRNGRSERGFRVVPLDADGAVVELRPQG